MSLNYVAVHRQGSVIVEFKMIFTKNVEDPLEPLQEAVKNGKLGNMTVEMQKYGRFIAYIHAFIHPYAHPLSLPRPSLHPLTHNQTPNPSFQD